MNSTLLSISFNILQIGERYQRALLTSIINRFKIPTKNVNFDKRRRITAVKKKKENVFSILVKRHHSVALSLTAFFSSFMEKTVLLHYIGFTSEFWLGECLGATLLLTRGCTMLSRVRLGVYSFRFLRDCLYHSKEITASDVVT